MTRRISAVALACAPGAAVIGFAFAAGGYFPGAVAIGTLALGALLVLRITLARRPLEGLSAPYVAAAAALALFALWTLVSSRWSDAPARALVEYDRALLYLLAFVVFGLIGRTPGRLRWMARAVAAGAVVVCACGLVTRLAPDLWSVPATISTERLSYPLTYWNALGLLAGIGFVLCLGLTSDVRESRAGRVLAAAALPVLAATLLLTFSRGAIIAAAAGVVVLVVVGRPAALLSGLLAGAPATWVAVRAAYEADLLASATPASAAAIAQGHDVAQLVGLCVLGAALARALLLVLDAGIARISLPARMTRPRVRWGVRAALGAVAVVVAVAAGAPAAVENRYEVFLGGGGAGEVDDGAAVRDRLASPSANGRIQHWDVARKAFAENRLHGDGAGTYDVRWDRDRPVTFQVEDAHSLYYEVAGELGVVGLVLLCGTLLLMLGGLLARSRGPDRMAGAALFAAMFTWALHAGVDWDWEMPAVTLWVFAAGGLGLAAALPAGAGAPPVDVAGERSPSRTRATGGTVRLLTALGVLLLLLVPIGILRSEAALQRSAQAFARGDCAVTVDAALDSIAVLGIRPEPYVLLGYCDVRLGEEALAVRAMERAAALDPANWEVHYGLALVRAAAGMDPRGAAREAARLNPSDSDLATAAVTLFRTGDPAAWRRRALRAPLPRR